jgi:hypothetical protein
VVGILHGIEYSKQPSPPRERQPYRSDLETHEFILAAIDETKRCREIEDQRAELAQCLSGIFDDELKAATDRALGKGYSGHTVRQYKGEFQKFRDWCLAEGFSSLPSIPEAVAYYLISRAAEGVKPNALERALAAIKYAHVLFDHSGHHLMHHYCDLDAPVVAGALSWIRKNYEVNSKGKQEKNNGRANGKPDMSENV